MTQRERMTSGIDYFPLDQELENDRNYAKNLCYDINHTRPSQLKERKEYIKTLMGSLGNDFYIEPPFFCDYGYNIHLGNGFYCNHNLVILDCAEVKIGRNCFIAPHVGLYTACHPIEAAKRNAFIEHAKPITIGDNVWIGGGVTVLPGVTIGDNVIIGAGSVVVKDIPSNVIAVGNPCKAIKEVAVNQAELESFYSDPLAYRDNLVKKLNLY